MEACWDFCFGVFDLFFFFFNLAYYKEQAFLVLYWSNYVMGLPDGT